jgi:hypothetical protein
LIPQQTNINNAATQAWKANHSRSNANQSCSAAGMVTEAAYQLLIYTTPFYMQ